MTYLQQQLPNVTGFKADLLASPDKVKPAIAGSRWVFNNSAPFTGDEKNDRRLCGNEGRDGQQLV